MNDSALKAKLEEAKGIIQDILDELDGAVTIISTPFGNYRKDASGKKVKVELKDGVWVPVEEDQTVIVPVRVPVQLNASPEPGVVYPKIDVPEGHHIEYDWGNHEQVLCKTC